MTDLKETPVFAGVPAIGLGCMNLSHAYGRPPSPDAAEGILHRAFEIGIRHFDTAALYGFGKNEALVGKALKAYCGDILLASKCGMTGIDGKKVIDGRPETLLKTCDESLRRLQADVIELYYFHRWDKNLPSANTLRKAHAIQPISAVQSEYSLWSRNVEVAVLDACVELGVTFVAFSPLARGFLTDTDIRPADFAEKDIRRGMPRFQEPHFSRNADLLDRYRALANETSCTAAQLALAWLLNKYPGIHVIPGTTSLSHLEENFQSMNISLDPDVIEQVDSVINSSTVSGPRYNAVTQAEIDTEEIAG
jgi:aryl-alcohol dehydrogenase-like predicted oxidoreductase